MEPSSSNVKKSVTFLISKCILEYKESHKAIKIIIGIAAIVFVLFLVVIFIKITNNNSGFITALGLLFVVPLSIISTNIIEHNRKIKIVNGFMESLMDELWHNLNHIHQISESHLKNVARIDNNETSSNPEIGIPRYGPRLAILDKIVANDYLYSLDQPYRRFVSDIYVQLSGLKEEFEFWKKNIMTMDLSNKNLYEAISSTMMTYIAPLMQNMLTVWVDIIIKIGSSSCFPQIHKTALTIQEKLKDGKMHLEVYKTSLLQNISHQLLNDGVVICWVNDWSGIPCNVIELKDIADLQ